MVTIDLQEEQIVEKNKKKPETSVDTNQSYWIGEWGEGYFHVNEEGNVVVTPYRDHRSVDLYHLVRSLEQRGIEAPVLIRFDGIIRDRIQRLYSAFDKAIEEFSYQNYYQIAYPIKVNQQKEIVQVICSEGDKRRIGVEVGSKPELLAMIPADLPVGSLLLCNGYKDRDYIELALLAKKIGKRSVITIEQLYELQFVLDISEGLGIEPEIGFRMKPFSKTEGHWASSGGELSKFGMDAHEMILAFEQLKKRGKENTLKLLHFHIGSQAASILSLRKAFQEAARMYTELAKLTPSLSFFDIGGGLAVDYDGSKTSSESSMNYTLEEYARDVVYAIDSACKAEGIAPPIIISESGRAIVAHHSMLITEVIDVSSLNPLAQLTPPPLKNNLLSEFYTLYSKATAKNSLEILHNASYLRDNVLEGFIQGKMGLKERAYAEQAYRYLTAKLYHLSKNLKFVPEDIAELKEKLIDIYFCNFSIFQSLPDAWAIEQIFPIMPIHRLNTPATRRAHIVDLTCDSDGIIDHFVHPNGPRSHIHLHPFDSSPYYLGIFLIGAYQEILGGLHNLFGDTNAIHIDFDAEGNWEFKHFIEGDTMREVLSYAQYNVEGLVESLRIATEKSLKLNHLSNEESALLKKRFKAALDSYTYLMV